MGELKEWISTKEAADLCGIHRNNVLKAVREGRLAGVKIGGRVLVKKSDAEAYKAKR